MNTSKKIALHAKVEALQAIVILYPFVSCLPLENSLSQVGAILSTWNPAWRQHRPEVMTTVVYVSDEWNLFQECHWDWHLEWLLDSVKMDWQLFRRSWYFSTDNILTSQTKYGQLLFAIVQLFPSLITAHAELSYRCTWNSLKDGDFKLHGFPRENSFCVKFFLFSDHLIPFCKLTASSLQT